MGWPRPAEHESATIATMPATITSGMRIRSSGTCPGRRAAGTGSALNVPAAAAVRARVPRWSVARSPG